MRLPAELVKKILIDSGILSAEDLEISSKYAQSQNKDLVDIMVERGVVLESSLGRMLGTYFGLPYVDLKAESLDPQTLSILSEDFCSKKRAIVFKKDARIYHVAIENPKDIVTTEFIKRSLGKIKLYFTLPSSTNFALTQFHGDIKQDLETVIKENVEASKDGYLNSTETPIIKIFDSVLALAVTKKASDIHIENLGDKSLVRFRVDGMLKDILTLPVSVHEGLSTRVKILANLRIDEHRVPQDGRLRFNHQGEEVSARVSLLPTLYGEDINMRLLFTSHRPKSLEDLGLTGKNLDLVMKAIRQPHGMILSTGPTGSGKSTTLYNILNILNVEGVNIITIEDPVEYTIPRVTQIQVNNQAGLTFAAGLRSILRHDPNIVLVGEIRDKETADLATQASLTGHLVLSTLHTNSAVDTVPRMFDLGIEPYLISATLSIAIGQRLVRKIHQKCITLRKMTDEDYDVITQVMGKERSAELKRRNFKVAYGEGCKACNGTGFEGRIGIYEVFAVDDDIRAHITRKGTSGELDQLLKKKGYITMIEDGLDKVSAGMTTLNEIFRAVTEE